MLTCLSRILVFCWCNHLWRSGQLFFVHFLMSVSGFRWWDHKPLLHIPGLVVGSWGSWFLLLVSFWSTADCSLVRSKLFVYNKRSGSAGVRHSIFYAFSVGVMNWFVREKDDYMLLLWKLLFVLLYHSHFGGLWTTFLQIIMSKFNVMNFHHLFYKTCTYTLVRDSSVV